MQKQYLMKQITISVIPYLIRKRKKVKDEKINNNTPYPEEISTPTGNYDRSKIPGELIFNFNDIPLNDEIEKVENDLGEFIVDQKN